ncbi:DUF523 domain-containing protein [Agarivorans sp.]|uniref:DUF523 domain-containing protein n=1 Tax=Agarivorans sp. TaxID=1872412 RepID=UPI003D024E06
MQKILVSACLLGNKVRYNAGCLSMARVDLDWLEANLELVVFCPEQSAGLPTPRAPAEIIQAQGIDVLQGRARVLANDGSDVTQPFVSGAENALKMCQSLAIKYALLAEASPSCGSSTIYDGSFSGRKVEGAGVTAALLEQAGIQVFNQYSISQLKAALAADV